MGRMNVSSKTVDVYVELATRPWMKELVHLILLMVKHVPSATAKPSKEGE